MRNDPKHKHGTSSLSSSFCRLLTDSWNIQHEELHLIQIGKIYSIDTSIFFSLMESPEEDYEYRLPYAKSEQERQLILNEIKMKEEKLAHNFPKVRETLLSLIEKLQDIPNLPQLLKESPNEQSALASYFADFNSNPGDGYIGNNFGQDLRSFKKYLELAASYGATRVWFSFG
ncbi:MAG: hypothetical protein R8P61_37405 [Bacteroidia bacterium]|nr:hypothetical protein [Bacteroidia bacterium]